MNSNEKIRPIIRWAGSKRRLAKCLLPHLRTDFKCYYEPFVGSASLFFALRPGRAVLGDVNADLINAYTLIRRNPVKIANQLAGYPVNEETYYGLRSQSGGRQLQRAIRFLYLNRFSFNGVYRTNRQGRFNVPFGSKTGSLPSVDEFLKAAGLLKTANLVCGDFAQCLASAKKGDLAYLDPPYHSLSRPARGEYGYGVFGDEDILRLASVALRLERLGVSVLISYKQCSKLRDLLSKWCITEVPVRRQVAAKTAARKMSSEWLLSSWPIGPIQFS